MTQISCNLNNLGANFVETTIIGNENIIHNKNTTI